MEPTSEQELRQLLEEGTITEDEYQELLETIRKKEMTQKPIKPKESKPRSSYGKAALILMISALILPIVAILISLLSIWIFGLRMGMFLLLPSLAIGFLCGLLAFIFGIVGWKTPQGKIAAIGVPCLGLLIVPGFLLLSFFHVARPVVVEQPEQSSTHNFVRHKAYSLDSLESVLAQEDVEIDSNIFAEGSGALRVEYHKPETRTIQLFETGPISIDNRMLIYSAKLRAAEMGGKAYLEMLCHIPGSGEFFSRSIDQPVTQTTWTTTQTPFSLETGYMPDNIKLNLVVEGPGTVWIDDIKLLSSPLN